MAAHLALNMCFKAEDFEKDEQNFKKNQNGTLCKVGIQIAIRLLQLKSTQTVRRGIFCIVKIGGVCIPTWGLGL
ncbi:hypothetical protein ACLB2K_009906 [Fragaria x ananassa]